MDTSHEALVLFYSFFWAVALGMTGRYEPFDTPSMWKRERLACNRFIVSIITINVFPIVCFFILYSWVIPDEKSWTSIIAAAISSLSVFGFHRLLHAFVASDQTYRHFYTDEQVSQVRCRDKFTQPQTFWSHFGPGLLYLVFFPGFAWLITLF